MQNDSIKNIDIKWEFEKEFTDELLLIYDLNLDKSFDDDLIAFMTTNDEKLAKIADTNSFIPAKYIEVVKEGLKNYDDNFIKEFEKTFENYPFTLKDGSYVFTDPIQNKVAREGIQSQNESK